MDYLGIIRERVMGLEPGQRVDVAWFLMKQFMPSGELAYFLPKREAGEIVLSGIVGSAYEWRYWDNIEKGVVTFERLKDPLGDGDLRTFVDWDRKEYFDQLGNGLWKRNDRPFIRRN